jgi:PE-PPE domain
VSEAFPYHTDVYTQEYDGFADFPKYPADVLADANAIAGILYEHLTYADLSQQAIADAIPLTTTGG